MCVGHFENTDPYPTLKDSVHNIQWMQQKVTLFKKKSLEASHGKIKISLLKRINFADIKIFMKI